MSWRAAAGRRLTGPVPRATVHHTIAEKMILMAHKLGLKAIAEGVETQEQLDLLKLAGCDYAQGFLFSSALPLERFEDMLRSRMQHRTGYSHT